MTRPLNICDLPYMICQGSIVYLMLRWGVRADMPTGRGAAEIAKKQMILRSTSIGAMAKSPATRSSGRGRRRRVRFEREGDCRFWRRGEGQRNGRHRHMPAGAPI